MNNLVKIGNSDLSIKEFNGQRVVTFKDVDSVHERPDGTARKRFNDNRSRFIEGEDFYKICPSEIRTHKIMEISEMAREDVTLLTESGYLMLVKSFTDDLAWEVQRELVKTYFNKKKPMSPVEMMRIQLGMIDDHEGRIAGVMKQPKKLTLSQKKLLVDLGLSPKEWMNLFEDDLYLHIVKKDSSDRKIIDKEERVIVGEAD